MQADGQLLTATTATVGASTATTVYPADWYKNMETKYLWQMT